MSKPVLALNSIRGQSGKDTLIEQIEAQGLRVHRVAFADTLKRECAQVLAGDIEWLARKYEGFMHQSAKDSKRSDLTITDIADSRYREYLLASGEFDPHEARSLRWHLQQYGTEFVREHLGLPDYWLDKGSAQVIDGVLNPAVDVVVVTDMRLPNEYGRLASGLNAHLIRIVRNWFNPEVDSQPYHQSDISLMAHRFDALVVNEWGKPEVMFDQIKRFL